MNPDRPVRVKVYRCTPVAWFRPAYSATTVNHRGHDLLTHTFPTWADAMAFADRLRGEEIFAHEMLQWSFDPALPASDHER